jgi:hypothetical protein
MYANFGQSESMIRALSASVLCSDGTSDVDNGFAPPCSGHGGEAEIMDEESTPSNDVVDVESEMFPDDLSEISDDENPCARVRCIALYKPCPEGYIDADPCCPHTGNCIPDPNYVGVAQPSLPIGQTPSVQFDTQTPIAIAQQNYYESTYRNQTEFPIEDSNAPTLLESSSTPATETTAPEQPKEGGLGVLAIGLIALKVLAT